MTRKDDAMLASERSVKRWINRIRSQFSAVPMLGWLFAALVAVILEQLVVPPMNLLRHLLDLPTYPKQGLLDQ